MDYLVLRVDLFRGDVILRAQFSVMLRFLLTAHHLLLHVHYCTQVREQQDARFLDSCGIDSTVRYAQKMRTRRNGWSQGMGDLNTVVAIVDEVQTIGILEVAGMCT